jgi:hypothetical protein
MPGHVCPVVFMDLHAGERMAEALENRRSPGHDIKEAGDHELDTRGEIACESVPILSKPGCVVRLNPTCGRQVIQYGGAIGKLGPARHFRARRTDGRATQGTKPAFRCRVHYRLEHREAEAQLNPVTSGIRILSGSIYYCGIKAL